MESNNGVIEKFGPGYLYKIIKGNYKNNNIAYIIVNVPDLIYDPNVDHEVTIRRVYTRAEIEKLTDIMNDDYSGLYDNLPDIEIEIPISHIELLESQDE